MDKKLQQTIWNEQWILSRNISEKEQSGITFLFDEQWFEGDKGAEKHTPPCHDLIHIWLFSGSPMFLVVMGVPKITRTSSLIIIHCVFAI